MRVEWQGRVAQAAVKYGEHAPTAATCCNACRACVQTNIIAGVLAGVVAVSAGVGKFAHRIVKRT